MTMNKSLAIFLIVLILLSGCVNRFRDRETTTIPETTTVPTALTPSKFRVGYQLLKVPMENQDPLVVALWYPTKEESEFRRYVSAIPHLEGKVAVEAAPARDPFPLVIFSHGGIGAGVCAMAWAEALATEGFVVAAPDHKDQVVLLRSDLEKPPTLKQKLDALRWAMSLSRKKEGSRIDPGEYEHRPQEIRATIDYLLKVSSDEESDLHALVDPNRIGLTGVSFGSWTAAAIAGGISIYHDPRIKAVIPMAPTVGKLNLAQIHVPLMIIFGEKETLVLLDKRPNAPLKEKGLKADYEKANPPKFLVGIKEAEHLDFDADGMTTRASLQEGGGGEGEVYSTAEVRENDAVIRTIVRYQFAFWRRYLLDDRIAEELLTTWDKENVYMFEADLGS